MNGRAIGNEGKTKARKAQHPACKPVRPSRGERLFRADFGHSLLRPEGAVARGVEVWRGGVRLNMSVSAPFVWRCLSGSAIAPFPRPAHRTGHADFPHPAPGQDLTPSLACDAIGSF
jgi:hypothetical protein